MNKEQILSYCTEYEWGIYRPKDNVEITTSQGYVVTLIVRSYGLSSWRVRVTVIPGLREDVEFFSDETYWESLNVKEHYQWLNN